MMKNKEDLFFDPTLDEETIEFIRENDRVMLEERSEKLFASIMDVINRAKASQEQTEVNPTTMPVLVSDNPMEKGSLPKNDEKNIDMKSLREKIGMNQGQFAKELGVSQALICLIENGKVKMSKKMVAKVEEFRKAA